MRLTMIRFACGRISRRPSSGSVRVSGIAALMCLGVRGAPIETAVDELMNGLVAYGRPVSDRAR